MKKKSLIEKWSNQFSRKLKSAPKGMKTVKWLSENDYEKLRIIRQDLKKLFDELEYSFGKSIVMIKESDAPKNIKFDGLSKEQRCLDLLREIRSKILGDKND